MTMHVPFVLSIVASSFWCSTYASSFIGKTFEIEAFGALNISNPENSNEGGSPKTESEKLLAQCSFVVRGDKVPSPFKSLTIYFSPKTRTIYSVRGSLRKPEGVFFENKKLRTLWNKCGRMLNEETGMKPTDKDVGNYDACCSWKSSDITAQMSTSKSKNRIEAFVLSQKLLALARSECPKGTPNAKSNECKNVDEHRNVATINREALDNWRKALFRNNYNTNCAEYIEAEIRAIKEYFLPYNEKQLEKNKKFEEALIAAGYFPYSFHAEYENGTDGELVSLLVIKMSVNGYGTLHGFMRRGMSGVSFEYPAWMSAEDARLIWNHYSLGNDKAWKHIEKLKADCSRLENRLRNMNGGVR